MTDPAARLAPEVQAWLRDSVGLDHPGTFTLRIYVGKGPRVFKVVRVVESEETIVVNCQERRDPC